MPLSLQCKKKNEYEYRKKGKEGFWIMWLLVFDILLHWNEWSVFHIFSRLSSFPRVPGLVPKEGKYM